MEVGKLECERGFALDKVDFTTEDTSSNAEDTSSSGLLPDDMTQMEFQKKMGSAPKLRRGGWCIISEISRTGGISTH